MVQAHKTPESIRRLFLYTFVSSLFFVTPSYNFLEEIRIGTPFHLPVIETHSRYYNHKFTPCPAFLKLSYLIFKSHEIPFVLICINKNDDLIMFGRYFVLLVEKWIRIEKLISAVDP
jgi:hypothetical protein